MCFSHRHGKIYQKYSISSNFGKNWSIFCPFLPKYLSILFPVRCPLSKKALSLNKPQIHELCESTYDLQKVRAKTSELYGTTSSFHHNTPKKQDFK